jgi:putative methyltransferase (TIGR04325 family)
MSFNIWEGIYNSFKECPESGDGHESETWVSKSLERTHKLLDAAKEKKTIPTVVAYQASLLPFLVALVTKRTENKKINILDFGGGLGVTYIPVINSCEYQEYIDYHIVETKNICEVGRHIFKDDARIHFYSSLPQKIKKMDIVHIGSSIQYIEDWRTLISELAGYNPQFFLFTDLTAGDIPTYVSVQNYYESKIPCWFFNIHGIIDKMLSVKFRLLFKSSFTGIYLGKEQEVFQLQSNFPEKYRLKNTCSLLFSREPI